MRMEIDLSLRVRRAQRSIACLPRGWRTEDVAENAETHCSGAAGRTDRGEFRKACHIERHSASDRFLGRMVRAMPPDGPGFAAVAAKVEPHLRLGKVDTEAEQALASRFAIQSIPSLVLVEKGRRSRGLRGEARERASSMDRGCDGVTPSAFPEPLRRRQVLSRCSRRTGRLA